MNDKKKIIIRGGYGLTNFGDDALLKSIQEDYFSSYRSGEVAYSCTDAPYLKKYIPDNEIIPLQEDYSNLCDILIYGGGTQFYSFGKPGFKNLVKSRIRLILKPKLLFEKISKKIKQSGSYKKIPPGQVKKMAFGIGLGPFLPEGDSKIEEKVKALFKEMHFVSVRDVYSFNKCKEWGVSNLFLHSDLCFKMNHEKFFKKNNSKLVKKIGIIVRDWNHTEIGEEYKKNLIMFANQLKREGKKVDFIIFSKKRDLKWIDYLIRHEVDLVEWNPDSDLVTGFIDVLAEYDLFITSRYHGAIFSSMLGKPFISIEVEQKLKLVHELFSSSSELWKSPFNYQQLLKCFYQINNNYGDYSKNMHKLSLHQRYLAEEMADRLSWHINSLLLAQSS